MAEAQLTGAIGLLREENNKKLAELNENQEKTAAATQETARLIGDMLDGMAIDRQRGQDREEGSPSGGPSGGGGGGNGPLGNDSIGLIGILGGIVAGLSGAVLGLVYGIVKTVTSPFTQLAKSTKDFFKNTRLVQFVKTKFTSMITTIKNFFKPVTNFFTNISKAFKAGLRGETRALRGAMGRFVSLQKGITGFFASIGRMTNKFILQPFNRIRRALGSIGRVMNGVTVQTGRVGQFFTKIGDGFKMVGRLFSGFARTFGAVFRAFAVVGRVLAWPITVITGLIGGIKGMFADFTKSREEGDGLLKSVTKGFFGFIKGAVNGIIMMPLDLLKSGIGWIAGKLGFENFENLLSGFSFSGLFSGLVDGVVNGVFGFFDGYIQLWKDAFASAKEGFAEGGIFGAISGFFGSIATSIKNVFLGLIEKVFGMFEGGDDMFAALGEGIANIKQSIKDFFIGLLPKQGSFMSKFVPDSVYEWAGQPAVSESEGSGLPTEEPQAIESTPELKAAQMNAIKSGDTTELEKKKEEQRMSWEEKQKAEIERLQSMIESGETTFTWTDADIEKARAEGRDSAVEWMEYDNSKEGQADQIEEMRESLAIKERNLAEFKAQQAQEKADIEKYGDLDTAKLAKMDESRREKLLTRSRDLMMRHSRGEEVNLANKEKAERALAAEERRQAAMIVAPSTQVVNNNSSQGIVMNQNMPAVDPLDQSYGVA